MHSYDKTNYISIKRWTSQLDGLMKITKGLMNWCNLIFFSWFQTLESILQPFRCSFLSIKNRWPIQLASVNGNSYKAFFPSRVSSLNKSSIYLFWVNNGNTRKRHEICSKLIIKTSKGSDWRCSGVVSVRFEHISHCFLLSLIRTLNR